MIVAGTDRKECEAIARRLRALAHESDLHVNVHETNDALDVQRLGKLGACTLLADGVVVAHDPFPGDGDLKRLLIASVARTAAHEFGMTA